MKTENFQKKAVSFIIIVFPLLKISYSHIVQYSTSIRALRLTIFVFSHVATNGHHMLMIIEVYNGSSLIFRALLLLFLSRQIWQCYREESILSLPLYGLWIYHDGSSLEDETCDINCILAIKRLYEAETTKSRNWKERSARLTRLHEYLLFSIRSISQKLRDHNETCRDRSIYEFRVLVWYANNAFEEGNSHLRHCMSYNQSSSRSAPLCLSFARLHSLG